MDGAGQAVVLVTGASRGIGRSIALELADAGHPVLLHASRPSAALEEVRELCDSRGARAQTATYEMADLQAVEGLARAAIEASVGAVVCNAGVYEGHPLAELTPAVWDATLAVDLRGPVFLLRALAKRLADANGSAVLISSIMGVHPSPNAYAYQAAKSAMSHLTSALALEWAPRVRVNAVAPGFVRTDINRAGWESVERRDRVATATPLGRWGEPEDIAHAVRFLLGDQAAFITGQTLVVDGGKSLR